MSSQLGRVVALWPHLPGASKITAEKGSVGKSIVHHEKPKHHLYIHTFNEEYDIDKKGTEKATIFPKVFLLSHTRWLPIRDRNSECSF